MPKQSSDKSNFKSTAGGGFVSPSQYLAEIICARLAKRENIDLPNKFWNQPRWRREYKKQILVANSLLKNYSISVILKVLTEKPMVYSLHAKWLDPYFQQATLEEKAKFLLVEDKVETKSKVNELASDKQRSGFSSKKNIIDRLD